MTLGLARYLVHVAIKSDVADGQGAFASSKVIDAR